jgi:hypothetical protein
MQTLYVYPDNDGFSVTQSDYILTGYHDSPVKIGDIISLRYPDGNKTCKVLDIRQQWWNGDNNPETNPSLFKYILTETDPSYKNWLKVKNLSDIREEKLNEIL